jgi:hypothetical protein
MVKIVKTQQIVICPITKIALKRATAVDGKPLSRCKTFHGRSVVVATIGTHCADQDRLMRKCASRLVGPAFRQDRTSTCCLRLESLRKMIECVLSASLETMLSGDTVTVSPE